MSEPKAPAGLQRGGRRLWAAVVADCELDVHEEELLEQACRTLDVLDRLDVLSREPGPMPNPVLVEMRQQGIVFARLLAALRLPDDADVRPQRRSSRGVYQSKRAERMRLIEQQRARLSVVR